MSLVHPIALMNPSRLVRSEEDIKKCPMYPLIEALHNTYGLKVMAADYRLNIVDAISSIHTVYLSYDDVACVGYVSMCVNRKKTAYQFCSVTYQAKRGNVNDRSSLKSVNVRVLMKMIKENNAVPPDGSVVFSPRKVGKSFSDISRRVITSFDSVRKSDWMTPDEMHEVLAIVLNGGNATNLSQESIAKCKLAVDRWDRSDNIRKERDKEINAFFESPLTLIGHDYTGAFIVGEIKYINPLGESPQHELTKPFVRCHNLLEIPELRAKLVMLKAHLQAIGYTRGFVNDGVFPSFYDKYISELGIVCAKDCYGMPSYNEYNWMLVA
jgi:hypothetical protein